MVGRLTVLIFSNSCPSIKWLKFIHISSSHPSTDPRDLVSVIQPRSRMKSRWIDNPPHPPFPIDSDRSRVLMKPLVAFGDPR